MNKNVTPRQQIVVLLVGVLIFCAGYYYWPSDQPTAVQVPIETVVKEGPQRPQKLNTERRDPFASAADSPIASHGQQLLLNNQAAPILAQQGKLSAAAASGARAGASNTPAAKSVQPELRGIVAGDQSKAAIIEYQGSRSYIVGESVGAWKIAAIYQSAVILYGPSGKLTLSLGR
jgi:hypothetical protein